MTTIKAMELKCKELKAKVDYAYGQLVEAKTADAEAWMTANNNYTSAMQEWSKAEDDLLAML